MEVVFCISQTKGICDRDENEAVWIAYHKNDEMILVSCQA